MTILYFTATGNSLYVAKGLGDATLISIPQAIRENRFSFSDEKIGIICPVYGWNPMPYVLEFLKKAEFRTDYLFAVLTYGALSGNAPRILWNFGQRGGQPFSYIGKVLMPDNYLPFFSMEAQKKTEGTKRVEEQIARIREEIGQGVIRQPGVSAGAPVSFLLGSAQMFRLGKGTAASYWVADSCIGCGTCVSVCPTGNVKLEQKHPVFAQQCVSCMACIQNCPVQAIHMTGERGSERYRNSHVTVTEIIDANHRQ